MNICFVGLEIVPVRSDVFVGGLSNNVVRLAKGLSRRGHQIHIITSDTNHVLKKDYTAPWGEIHPVWTIAPYLSILYELELLFKLLHKLLREWSKGVFDILHIHSAYSSLNIISFFASFFLRLPIVFTLYSPIPKGPFCSEELYRRLSSSTLSRLYLLGTDQIIGVSENVVKSLETIGIPGQKIECIPPAVDVAIFNPKLTRPEAREEIGVNGNTSVILYCGNWTPWKGVEVLLDSMSIVKQKFPEVILILAWGEPIEWYLSRKCMIRRKIKSLGLESNVIEIGIVKEIEKIISISDVVVIPFLKTYGVSDRPLIVLEAMASGKPVIATKIGGIPEIIENGVNGILVNKDDRSELEKAICMLLNNKRLAYDISVRAHTYISQNYSIDRLVTRLEEVYEKFVMTK